VHHITNQIVEVIEGCTEQNFAKVVDF